MKIHRPLLAIALGILTFTGSDVRADDLVCAAVLPCNADGSVQAPYSQGACAARYARDCTFAHAKSQEDKLVACEDSSSKKDRQISKLRKELRKARRASR